MSGHEVNAAGAVVKVRRPWAVALLSLVPVYWLVWYFRINREMRDFGRQRGDDVLAHVKPWIALLAVSIGSIFVVPLCVSVWRTVRRIQRSERAAAVAGAGVGALAVLLIALFALTVTSNALGDSTGGLAAAFAALVVLLTVTTVIQQRLNALWRRYAAVSYGIAPDAPLASDVATSTRS
jgi:protein-S-isoprenylcysteine O-methyltransferase Ste14